MLAQYFSLELSIGTNGFGSISWGKKLEFGRVGTSGENLKWRMIKNSSERFATYRNFCKDK